MEDQQARLTYREFVDEMVSLAQHSVSADRIAAGGDGERADIPQLPLTLEELARKRFCQDLLPDQKAIVAQLLVEERKGAIHDVLAYLEWAISTERIAVIAAEGSFMEATKETLHGDFISRADGFGW